MRKLVGFLLSAFLVLAPSIAFAQFNADSSGLKDSASAAFGEIDAQQYNLPKFIGVYVIQPVVGLLGLLFLCLMIYAGFLWMSAAGDDKKVAKAKEILRSAIIGAVIIIAAYAITDFVFTALSGAAGPSTG